MLYKHAIRPVSDHLKGCGPLTGLLKKIKKKIYSGGLKAAFSGKNHFFESVE